MMASIINKHIPNISEHSGSSCTATAWRCARAVGPLSSTPARRSRTTSGPSLNKEHSWLAWKPCLEAMIDGLKDGQAHARNYEHQPWELAPNSNLTGEEHVISKCTYVMLHTVRKGCLSHFVTQEGRGCSSRQTEARTQHTVPAYFRGRAGAPRAGRGG